MNLIALNQVNTTFESAGRKGSVVHLFSFNLLGIARGIFLLIGSPVLLGCVGPKPLELVNTIIKI